MRGKHSRRTRANAALSGLLLGREAAVPPPREPVGFAPADPARRPERKPSGEGAITYGGDGHLITFAPTGTGKTAGPVICNALTWPGQLIVLDIKGEVHRATARRRHEMGQAVHVLDLRDGNLADSLNPLDLALLTGTDVAAVARSLAAELVARTGRERDPFWNDQSENLLTAGIAWLLADVKPADRHLGHLYDLLTSDDSTFEIAKRLDCTDIRHRAAIAGFGAYLNLPGDNTRPSVLGTALMPLRLFDSDLVRHVTDRTTVDLSALVAGAPMTLYLIVPPARLIALRPLLRTWLSGLMMALTQREIVPEHRTLFLCDEIAQLGRLDAFLTASTLMRGYGMQLWTFWQNVAQLALYAEQSRTILDNAGVVQLFGARNRRMAEEFAALIGGIDADSIMAMAKDEQLLLIEGGVPRYARRMRYFEEPMFEGLYDDGAGKART